MRSAYNRDLGTGPLSGYKQGNMTRDRPYDTLQLQDVLVVSE